MGIRASPSLILQARTYAGGDAHLAEALQERLVDYLQVAGLVLVIVLAAVQSLQVLPMYGYCNDIWVDLIEAQDTVNSSLTRPFTTGRRGDVRRLNPYMLRIALLAPTRSYRMQASVIFAARPCYDGVPPMFCLLRDLSMKMTELRSVTLICRRRP